MEQGKPPTKGKTMIKDLNITRQTEDAIFEATVTISAASKPQALQRTLNTLEATGKLVVIDRYETRQINTMTYEVKVY